MQTSGKFGVPQTEVPQYMGNNNNHHHGSSSRGTSTASNSAAHGHMLMNLSPKVPSSLPSPPSHAHHGHSTFSSIAQDVAAAAPAAPPPPPPHGLFQEQAHQQHYHFLQQQSAENVQKLQEQIQQKKPAIQKQGIHLQQQTPMMAAQPPPDQNQDSHHGQQEQQQHSLAIQHQLGLGLESYEGPANVNKPSPASNFNTALVSADQTSLGAALDIDQAEEGGGAGNRWPRQETLALLKIRADMDASFRDSSVKRPLWEEVSRKLGELGYERSAKKCKEKFENVNKYYKRTKEGKAGRQDGKNYRFFTQLEALSANTNISGTPSSLLIGGSSTNNNNNSNIKSGAVDAAVAQEGFRVSSLQVARDIRTTESLLLASSAVGGSADPNPIPSRNNTEPIYRHLFADNSGGLHLSSESSSDGDGDDDDDDDDDDYEDPRPRSDPMQPRTQGKKRKRKRSGRMMAFFEGLLNKVIKKQEQMQRRFLEALEKRESERMIREEAWRRQEMARMSREHELRAQERSSAATRDATIVAFLQKVTGHTVQLPPESTAIAAQPVQSAPPLLHDNTVQSEDHDPLDPNSKRWLKPEVLALIKLHSSLHSKFTEANPKGPLWEEISNGMARLGYASRTAKRCKEKWENINKYFKKAKESNKKRPENAKTCPYFHELDALYRKGVLGGSQMVTSNVKQLPYKPIIDREYRDNENIMQQPSTSNTESHSGDGPVHVSEMLSIMPIEQGTASDASAFTSNMNVCGSNNNNSNMVATHVDNGGLSKGIMQPAMDSSQGDESTYDGLNVDSKASHARNGLTPDLELQLQQQSSIDLRQRNPHQQEYEKMNAGELGVAPQIQMQFAPKESRPSLASLPNSSSFMANLLHKLNSNITAEINASTTLANQE